MNGGVRIRRGRRQRQRGASRSGPLRVAVSGQGTSQTAALDDEDELDELRMLEDEEQRLSDRLDRVSDAIGSLEEDAKEVKKDATRR